MAYSNAALDLATLRIEVNSVDWTSLFTVGPSSATFIVDAQHELIARTLKVNGPLACCCVVEARRAA